MNNKHDINIGNTSISRDVACVAFYVADPLWLQIRSTMLLLALVICMFLGQAAAIDLLHLH